MNSVLVLLGITITALAPTCAIFTTYILNRRERKEVKHRVSEVASRLEATAGETGNKLDEIHVLVNDRLTETLSHLATALSRIASLEAALGLAHNEAIPPRRSKS